MQYDFDGQQLFQHRCQDKWRLGGNRHVESIAKEGLCFSLVQELTNQWSGVLWQNDNPTEQEQTLIDELTGSAFTYR